MAASKFSDLKPCRDLIDANFGGYKLSLDALPVYALNLSAGTTCQLISCINYLLLMQCNACSLSQCVVNSVPNGIGRLVRPFCTTASTSTHAS